MSTDTPDASEDPALGEPRIIAEFGGVVDETRVWLGVHGPDVDPDKITALLGVEPTMAHRRGDVRRSAGPWPRGGWILMRSGEPAQQPATVLAAMLDELPGDPQLWTRLRTAHEVRLTFGLHLDAFNRGFDLEPELVTRMAGLGATVGFDIYCDGEDIDGSLT